jgi:hypothetical protein
MDTRNDTAACEYFDERAAIMEFDGGLPRYQAEFYAVVATRRYCERNNRTPPQTLYYSMIVRDLSPDEPLAPPERAPF